MLFRLQTAEGAKHHTLKTTDKTRIPPLTGHRWYIPLPDDVAWPLWFYDYGSIQGGVAGAPSHCPVSILPLTSSSRPEKVMLVMEPLRLALHF